MGVGDSHLLALVAAGAAREVSPLSSGRSATTRIAALPWFIPNRSSMAGTACSTTGG